MSVKCDQCLLFKGSRLDSGPNSCTTILFWNQILQVVLTHFLYFRPCLNMSHLFNPLFTSSNNSRDQLWIHMLQVWKYETRHTEQSMCTSEASCFLTITTDWKISCYFLTQEQKLRRGMLVGQLLHPRTRYPIEILRPDLKWCSDQSCDDRKMLQRLHNSKKTKDSLYSSRFFEQHIKAWVHMTQHIQYHFQ